MPRAREVRRVLGVEEATRRGLMGGVVPLWLGAGLADWYRHRQTGIEENAGTKESVIHALMMTEAGVPVTLGLFCEVNAGVLAVCGGALGVHSLTAYWDVSYAEQHREVTPIEQHIHSLLEVVPLMATGFLAVLYWDQTRSLAGRGERPDFRIRLKREGRLSWKARAALLGAMGVFGALPYAEEMIRCARASARARAERSKDRWDVEAEALQSVS
ncbi:diguanylate cyclase [Actinomadura logoneensis]|uniref:Diguanylate cyclase n=1 Tax=Actinomadura logoneensis TaxID=2293572 RepID=A0A372JD83_9ACTN|nr:diguanylate cyclase [Actinomadura logoneensis]RFU37942.1 diguanylate cyclase [Actinomadura logoneensis]